MIQTQQHSLSDPEIETLKEWMASPGAALFAKVIRSELAFTQAASAELLMYRRVPGKEEDNQAKAEFLADRAMELQFFLDKFALMTAEDKPYEFKTTTLTP